ncbi:MAG: response regulator transcription factor [Lachnospiraceae bacterium]|nr:response regulator transcription factor [Lachnospiraceae bacterium]
MLRIGICEDITQELQQLENIVAAVLAELSLNADVCCFRSGEELLYELEESGSMDILFLDIQMNGLNGVETARAIRQRDNRAVMIFVSAYDQYCKELIEVQPFAFIDKPVSEDRVRQVLDHVMAVCFSMKEGYRFSYRKMQYNIPLSEIRFFQSDKRVVRISTSGKGGIEEEYVFYEKLEKVEKAIAQSGIRFLRVRKSFLVNPRYIVTYGANGIVLDNGLKVEISRNYKESVKQYYLALLRV